MGRIDVKKYVQLKFLRIISITGSKNNATAKLTLLKLVIRNANCNITV